MRRADGRGQPVRQRLHASRCTPPRAASPRPSASPTAPSAAPGTIVNPEKTNRARAGHVGYVLLPAGQPDAARRRRLRRSPARAAFATKHLWVTQYDPAERYAAGDFVNQHPGGAGLPAWIAADRAARRRGHRGVAHLRARRTSRAPRTGRSCRSTTPASRSSRSASSTATRRSTCPPRRPSTATGEIRPTSHPQRRFAPRRRGAKCCERVRSRPRA